MRERYTQAILGLLELSLAYSSYPWNTQVILGLLKLSLSLVYSSYGLFKLSLLYSSNRHCTRIIGGRHIRAIYCWLKLWLSASCQRRTALHSISCDNTSRCSDRRPKAVYLGAFNVSLFNSGGCAINVPLYIPLHIMALWVWHRVR